MARFFLPDSCSLDEEDDDDDDEEEEEENRDEDEEEEGYLGDFSGEEGSDDDDDDDSENSSTTPFMSPARNPLGTTTALTDKNSQSQQFSVMAVVVASLRKSLVTCSMNADDVTSDVDIGWPTDVRHVSHVTFDRFDGFLGLPDDLQSDVPRDSPSASASVFGVSAQSMQCSYDHRGNSVPTILLGMQTCLYDGGGLQAEGIFRINASNSQEEDVRNQLNKGVVPRGIDVHCLSGLIKAWFRELPSGVLDSLTPEQIVHCNTEEECTELLELLPPTEAALLNWAINLMADVAQNEQHNKMNARNIAMVFAPNMTQMADPLTALIHAVQVMNFLKTLILKTLRERLEPFPTSRFEECKDSFDDCSSEESAVASCDISNLSSFTPGRLESGNNHNSSLRVRGESNLEEKQEPGLGGTVSPSNHNRRTLEHNFKDDYNKIEAAEGILNRIILWPGMQKLRMHPVFQLSKMVKRSKDLVELS